MLCLALFGLVGRHLGILSDVQNVMKKTSHTLNKWFALALVILLEFKKVKIHSIHLSLAVVIWRTPDVPLLCFGYVFIVLYCLNI